MADAGAIVINLPDFNGSLGIGVAAFADAGLPDVQKLQVPNSHDMASHRAAVLTAAATIA
jgi:hypothetical protein